MLWDNASAIRYKIIDTLLYRDQVMDTMARLSGVNRARDLHFISHQKYLRVPKPREDKPYTRNKIAIIYAEGDIVSGDPGEGSIGSESISKAIRGAREDSTDQSHCFQG